MRQQQKSTPAIFSGLPILAAGQVGPTATLCAAETIIRTEFKRASRDLLANEKGDHGGEDVVAKGLLSGEVRMTIWIPMSAANQSGKETGVAMSVRLIPFFANFRGLRPLRWIFAAAVLATLAAPGVADARRVRMIGPGVYDGTWNVTFTPRTGNCHASNTVPFTVMGRRVSSAGNGKVSGGISANGSVSVRVTVGASWAIGSGRLAGSSGGGRWTGLITGDRCGGVWQASRA